MELPQVASLQDNAQSVVRAAQYVGRAADELRPLVVPAARTALEKVPGAASCAISRVKRVTPQTIREHSLAAGIVGGVLAAGLAAATVAHFVHRHKVAHTRTGSTASTTRWLPSASAPSRRRFPRRRGAARQPSSSSTSAKTATPRSRR